MLARSLFVVAAVAVAAIYVPGLAGTYLSSTNGNADPGAAKPQQISTARYTGNRGVTLDAGGNGHFSGVFKFNGRNVEGMIDTGASMVAINLSTADRIGIPRKSLDFRYAVDTANGKARAAFVRLDSVAIGSIKLADVDAIVLEDQALSGTLVGMSFLKGLSSYQVDGGKMRLIR